MRRYAQEQGDANIEAYFDQSKAESRSSNVTVQSNGINTEKCDWKRESTRLIHMLAKQETPIKARSRVLGRVPARLNTRVTMTLSMLVLLRAAEMVNPPIKSMIVGENIIENTNLG